MRYKYNDVTNDERKYYQDDLKFTINGVCLDDRLPFFDTLNVYGRELIARDIATKNYSTSTSGGKSRYGKNRYSTSIKNAFIGSTLGQRQLTIQYRLKSSSSVDAISNFETLQYYVNQEQAKLSFSDDNKFYYVGTFTSFEEVKSEKLDVIGKIMFECVDSYKYSFEQFQLNFNGNTTFLTTSKYPILIEEITITPSGTGGYVEISNSSSSSTIRILNTTTDKIIINTLDNQIADSANRNRMKDLGIFSDLEDFAISSGDTIAVVGASNCVVKYRERGL